MKKRILCVLLTLIMLMSLVPVAASAAGRSISENAITVLKQLEGYSSKCSGKGTTFGYGTTCTDKKHTGATFHGEKAADEALRDALAKLDTAINSFATSNGLSLTQSQHDALVLFSFQNGTAWTTGTGDFKAAVTSGATGSEFLSAVCRWNTGFDDDNRRMIEANMYLNGVYSSSRPTSFIRVSYNVNGGVMAEAVDQYYDVSKNPAPHVVPTREYHTFTGWYITVTEGYDTSETQVFKLNASHHGATLTAGWVPTYSMPGFNTVNYIVTEDQLVSQTVYKYNEKKATFASVNKKEAADYYILEEALYIDSEYLDEDGVRWCRIMGTTNTATSSEGYWVKVSCVGSTASYNNGNDIDVTVTVTNSYVNMRANATISSAKNGSWNQGDQLRIINTADADGYLWGQVAQSATDDTPIGWVALMYTNFESVRNGASSTVNNSKAIATAVISYPGYVNVRSDAGTDNKIVGALAKGTEVSLFETKFVNGQEWGRCSTGWFCLNYANVNRLVENDSYANDVGYLSYRFYGTINPDTIEIYKEPSLSADLVYTKMILDRAVIVTNLINVDGTTWGKISQGWIQVSDATGKALSVDLDPTTFTVTAESATVRANPSTSAARKDTLTKGVEFIVNNSAEKQIVVAGDTVWGWANKVGEDNKTYDGWVNLATKYVTRGNMPTIEDDTPAATGMVATVINTDALKVRTTGATYGAIIGSLSRGTTVTIWEEGDGWYKVDSNQNGEYDYEGDGWVSASYVNVYEATTGSSSSNSTASGSNGSATVETGMGIVANTYSGVNVRTGPGTGNAQVGKLLPGTAVEILEVTTAGNTKWGRVAEGWICMDYVTMVTNYEIYNSSASASESNSSSNVTEKETAIFTGTTKAKVNVRKEPSLKADIVRELEANANITLHEIVTVEESNTSSTTDSSTGSTTTTKTTTSYWARVNDGYIYNPADHLNLDTLDEVTYTMTESNTLNVRNNPGTNGTTVLFKLEKGDQVTITKLQIVNGKVWGYVECDDGEGWASLAYMTKGAVTIQDESESTNNNASSNNATSGNASANGTTNNVVIGSTGNTATGGFVTNSSGYKYTGKVIRTNEVNVRSTPSTAASKTTTLKSGASLVIYETTVAENMAWGRCDAGWVYLYYVDLTPCIAGAVDARVVYNDNTIAYSDVNCSSVAGTYSRMSVIDIYEIVGKMARTDLGWVNTDNLL